MNEPMMDAFYDQLEKIALTNGFFDEIEKLAARDLTTKEKALVAIDRSRPYAYRAAMGAVPGAVLGSTIGKGKAGGRVGALVGGAAGIADKALEDLSDSNRKYKKLLGSYQEKLNSAGGFGRKFVGGRVLRGTTDAGAAKKLRRAQRTGMFGESVKSKVSR